MARDLTKEDVPWSVRIDPQDYNTLANLWPMQGARTWLLNTGLRGFVELCEDSNAHQRWVHLAIGRHMASERPTQGRDLTCRVPSAMWFRFHKMFPEPGASSWFVRTFVHHIVEVMSGEARTLEERVLAMVKDIIEADESEVGTGYHYGADD